MAIITVLCAELIGVMMRLARSLREITLSLHAVTQTPQPRHQLSSSKAFIFLGFCGSCAETIEIASTGQACAHLLHPLQVRSISGKKFVVSTGFKKAKRLAAVSASQQQLQQLQIKLTPFCAFSPNCTSLCSLANSCSSNPSLFYTRRV